MNDGTVGGTSCHRRRTRPDLSGDAAWRRVASRRVTGSGVPWRRVVFRCTMVPYGCDGDGPCPRTGGRGGTSGDAVSGRTSFGLSWPTNWSTRRLSPPATSWSRSAPDAARSPTPSPAVASQVVALEKDPQWAESLAPRSRAPRPRRPGQGRPLRRPRLPPAPSAVPRHRLAPVRRDDGDLAPSPRRPGHLPRARRPHRAVGGGTQTRRRAAVDAAVDHLGAVVVVRNRPAHTCGGVPPGALGRRRRALRDPA